MFTKITAMIIFVAAQLNLGYHDRIYFASAVSRVLTCLIKVWLGSIAPTQKNLFEEIVETAVHSQAKFSSIFGKQK